jgi:hypothetical protein
MSMVVITFALDAETLSKILADSAGSRNSQLRARSAMCASDAVDIGFDGFRGTQARY